jgi:hypothetical protein
MKFDLTTESQPPAHRAAYAPVGEHRDVFFFCWETTANEKHQYFDKKIILDLKK